MSGVPQFTIVSHETFSQSNSQKPHFFEGVDKYGVNTCNSPYSIISIQCKMMKGGKKCKILHFKSGEVCFWVMILDIYIRLNILNVDSFAEKKKFLYLSKYNFFKYR